MLKQTKPLIIIPLFKDSKVVTRSDLHSWAFCTLPTKNGYLSVVILAAECILRHFVVYGRGDCLEQSMASIRCDIVYCSPPVVSLIHLDSIVVLYCLPCALIFSISSSNALILS